MTMMTTTKPTTTSSSSPTIRQLRDIFLDSSIGPRSICVCSDWQSASVCLQSAIQIVFQSVAYSGEWSRVRAERTSSDRWSFSVRRFVVHNSLSVFDYTDLHPAIIQAHHHLSLPICLGWINHFTHSIVTTTHISLKHADCSGSNTNRQWSAQRVDTTKKSQQS